MNAYLILDLKIHDLPAFSEYIHKIPRFIEKHGGKYIVQGAQPEPLEGDWKPERVVVIEFPSQQNARSFLHDPEAQPLFSIRHKATSSKLLLVDGCS